MSQIESTYKSREVEETIDLYFYRPLGYAIAHACRVLRITPNTVTIVSIMIGVIGGHLMYYRDLTLNAWGFVLWVVADALDSADGQLARLINHKSKLGRILDGIAGNVIFLSIYVHLLLRLAATLDMWWLWLFLFVLASGISHSIQSALADYYRNAYLKFVVDPTRAELEGSDEIRRDYHKVSFFTDPIRKLMLRFYLNYTVEQEAFSQNFQSLRKRVEKVFGYNIPSWFADEYRRLNLPLLKYYAVLTTNTRIILLFICVMLDFVWVYFLLEIVVFNALMVLVTMYQEKLSASLLKQIEKRREVLV